MKYVLFGTGDYYQRYKVWFKDREVVALLDNDCIKQGTFIDEIPVFAPARVRTIDFDVIVIMSFYVNEMKKQLLDLEVSSDQIYHFYDLHELFGKECKNSFVERKNTVLLLTHDLSLGGPSIALFNAACILKKNNYEVTVASMLYGPLFDFIVKENIPVIVDRRLQICTMKELLWTQNYDLVICNTINYHIFLSERVSSIPVIWWLHDARKYYDGVKKERLVEMNKENLKIVSVGPIPRMAMNEFLPEIQIDNLLYGVVENG